MASKKKVATKRQGWNKGLEVGKRDAFTAAQVKRIRGLLADRGIPGLREKRAKSDKTKSAEQLKSWSYFGN